MGIDLRNGDWIESESLKVKTNPHVTDTGTVTLVRYYAKGYKVQDVVNLLIGREYNGSGLYGVGADAEILTPQIVKVALSLEGVCSPKSVKRTFCGNRKEIVSNNPTWIKKLQAEYPSYQDEFLEGPKVSPSPLPQPPEPNPYWFTTDMMVFYEPFGWVILGDDKEDIPNTPFSRRCVKVQWFWQKEPGN